MAAASSSQKTEENTTTSRGNVKMLGRRVPLIIDTLPKDVILELVSVLLELQDVTGITLVFTPAVPKNSNGRFNIVKYGKLWKHLKTNTFNSSQDILYYIDHSYIQSSTCRLSVTNDKFDGSQSVINCLRLAVNYTAVAESVEVLDSKEQPTGIMRKDEKYINGTPKRISFYKGGKQYGEEVYFATNGQIIWRRFWLYDGRTSYLDGIEEKYFFLLPSKIMDVNGTKLLAPVPAITKYWIAGKEVSKEAFDGRKETVSEETPLIPDLANIVSKYL